MTESEKAQLISDDEFNKELNFLMGVEMKNLEENPTKDFRPKLVVVVAKDSKNQVGFKKIIVPLDSLDLNDEEAKEEGFRLIGNINAEKHIPVVAIFNITEAWVSHQKSPKKGDSFIQPRNDPNRGEAIIVAGLTVDKRNNMGMALFSRITEKEIIFTKTPQMAEYSKKDKNVVESPLLYNFFVGYFNELSKFRGMSKGSNASKMAN